MSDYTTRVKLDFEADVSKAKKEINELQNALSNVAKMPSKGESLFGDMGLQQASKAALELQQHIRNAVNVNTGKLDLSRFSSSLKTSKQDLNYFYNTLKKAGVEGQQAFFQVAKSIATADTPLIRVNKKLQEFTTTLKNTAKWQISSSLIHGFMGSLQSAYGYAQDLNESLNNIRIVTGQSTDQMAKFAKEANNAAKSLSTSTTSYTDAALIYYQQGLNDNAVKERTNATIKMANVTGQSASEVSSYMTAIWNNFDDGSKSLEHYADVITALGAATASSSAEIAEGLEKFASIGDTVGLSYEYATSALATVVAQTRQSADTVGTAFKTLFARIQDLELGETLDDGTTLGQYAKALEKVGINIKTSSGEMKNMDAILDEMGAKWNTLDKASQTALAQNVAGTRQYTQLVALMDNYDKFKSNLNVANTSEGTLQKQADIYAESWEAAQKRVKASLQELYSKLIDDEFFIKITDGAAKIVDAISLIIDGLGGVKGVLASISSIFLANIAKQMPSILKNTRETIMILTGQGSKAATKLRDDLNKILEPERAKAVTAGDTSTVMRIDGLRELAKAKEDLVKNSKYMTEAERQEREAHIRNIEAMNDETVALQKQLQEKEKQLKIKQETLNKQIKVNNDNDTIAQDNVKKLAKGKTLEDAREEIKTKINQNENTIKNNQDQIKGLKENKTQLNKYETEKTSLTTKMSSNQNALNQEQINLQNANKILNNKTNQKNANSSNKDTREKYQKILSDAEQQAKSSQEEINKLSKEISKDNKTLTDLQTKIDNLKAKIETAEAKIDITAQEDNIKKAKKQLKQQKGQVNDIDAAIAEREQNKKNADFLGITTEQYEGTDEDSKKARKNAVQKATNNYYDAQRKYANKEKNSEYVNNFNTRNKDVNGAEYLKNLKYFSKSMLDDKKGYENLTKGQQNGLKAYNQKAIDMLNKDKYIANKKLTNENYGEEEYNKELDNLKKKMELFFKRITKDVQETAQKVENEENNLNEIDPNSQGERVKLGNEAYQNEGESRDIQARHYNETNPQEELEPISPKLSQSVTEAAAGLMAFNAIAMQTTSIIDTLGDSSLSTGQKITTIAGSIGGIITQIPSLINGIKAIKNIMRTTGGAIGLAITAVLAAVVATVNAFNEIQGYEAETAAKVADANAEITQSAQKTAVESKEAIDSLISSYKDLKEQLSSGDIDSAAYQDKINEIINSNKELLQSYNMLGKARQAAITGDTSFLDELETISRQDVIDKSTENLENQKTRFSVNVWKNLGATEKEKIGGQQTIDVGFNTKEITAIINKYNLKVVDDFGHITVESFTEAAAKYGNELIKDLETNGSDQAEVLLNAITNNQDAFDALIESYSTKYSAELEKIAKDSYKAGQIKTVEEYENAVNDLAKKAKEAGMFDSWEEAVNWAEVYISSLDDVAEKIKVIRDAFGLTTDNANNIEKVDNRASNYKTNFKKVYDERENDTEPKNTSTEKTAVKNFAEMKGYSDYSRIMSGELLEIEKEYAKQKGQTEEEYINEYYKQVYSDFITYMNTVTPEQFNLDIDNYSKKNIEQNEEDFPIDSSSRRKAQNAQYLIDSDNTELWNTWAKSAYEAGTFGDNFDDKGNAIDFDTWVSSLDTDELKGYIDLLKEYKREQYDIATNGGGVANKLTNLSNNANYLTSDNIDKNEDYKAIAEDLDIIGEKYSSLQPYIDIIQNKAKVGTEEWAEANKKLAETLTAVAAAKTAGEDGIYTKEEMKDVSYEGWQSAQLSGLIDTETYEAGLNAVIENQLDLLGVTKEEWESYYKAVKKTNTELSDKDAKEWALQQVKLNKALENTKGSLTTYISNLKKAKKAQNDLEKDDAIFNIQKQIKELMGLDLSETFIENNEALIKRLDEGTATTKDIEKIQKEAANNLAASWGIVGVSAENAAEEAEEVWKNLTDKEKGEWGSKDSFINDFVDNAMIDFNELTDFIQNQNIDVGQSINLDSYKNRLANMIATGKVTVSQLQSYFSQLGFEMEAVKKEVTVSDRVEYIQNTPGLTDMDKGRVMSGQYDQTISYIAGMKITKIGGKPVGSSTSSGGGGGNTSTKTISDSQEDPYQTTDRSLSEVTHQVNMLNKAEENLAGNSLASALMQENTLLIKQAELYKDKLNIAKQVAEKQKQTLINDFGMTEEDFGDLKGFKVEDIANNQTARAEITNYNEQGYNAETGQTTYGTGKYNELYQDYVEKANKYNENTNDEKAKEAMEAAKEKLEKYEEALKNYLGTIDTQNSIEEALEDALNAAAKKALEAWEIPIKLKIDIEQIKKDWSGLWKNIEQGIDNIQIDYTKYLTRDIESANAQKVIAEQSREYINLGLQALANPEEYIGDGEGYKFRTKEDAAKFIQENMGNLKSALESLWQDAQTAYQDYMSAIDQSQKTWERVYENIKRLTDEIEAQEEAFSIMFGENSEISINYRLAKNSDINKVISEGAKQKYRQYDAENKALKDYVSDNPNIDYVTDERYITLKTNADNSRAALYTYAKESAETFSKQFEDTLAKNRIDLDKALFGENQEWLTEKWELLNESVEGYYDGIQKIYQISDIQSKWNQAINNANTTKAQEKLSKLMQQQVESLKQKTELTEFDIELANKRLEIAKAEIALEEAQANKTSMKLVRDSSGNWTYQYMADTSDLEAKQNDLNNQKNDLYTMTKNEVNENASDLNTLVTNYKDDIDKIWNDDSLTYEQKQIRAAERDAAFKKSFNNKMEKYSNNKESLKGIITEDITAKLDDYANQEGDSPEKRLALLIKKGVSKDSEEYKSVLQEIVDKNLTSENLKLEGLDANDILTYSGKTEEAYKIKQESLNNVYKNLGLMDENGKWIAEELDGLDVDASLAYTKSIADNAEIQTKSLRELSNQVNALLYGVKGIIAYFDEIDQNTDYKSITDIIDKVLLPEDNSNSNADNNNNNNNSNIEEKSGNEYSSKRTNDLINSISTLGKEMLDSSSLLSNEIKIKIGDELTDKVEDYITKCANLISSDNVANIVLDKLKNVTQELKENIFNINADFPNATNSKEIEEALLNLPNLASQYLSAMNSL